MLVHMPFIVGEGMNVSNRGSSECGWTVRTLIMMHELLGVIVGEGMNPKDVFYSKPLCIGHK
jgi:hypothetical protein